MDQAIGIRADDLGRRILLKEGNYRLWSSVPEESLREKKLRAHVDGTTAHPPPSRIRAPGIAGVPGVAGGAPGVAAVVEVTQEMVDADDKKIDDFRAAISRANLVILQSLEQKDAMGLYSSPTPTEKWAKLQVDYALVSSQMATEARARFFNFKMLNGETVVELQHRFDVVVSECLIQGLPETPERERAQH